MMTPDNRTEIFLMPGDFHFGDRHTRIRTVLGSCVSVTLWHPDRRIGGMCHFMLARRPPGRGNGELDGKYAEDALRFCLQAISSRGLASNEFEFRLFGAASMFAAQSCGKTQCDPVANACRNVSCSNANMVRVLMAKHGLAVKSADLGGSSHRSLMFDVETGQVTLRRSNQPQLGAVASGAAMRTLQFKYV